MDAMAHALKKKIGGVHITVEPIQEEVHGMEHKEPALDLEMDKENMDMAPDIHNHEDDEMSRLEKMIGGDVGDPVRKPMTLGERAKGKMKDRMSSLKGMKKK